MNFLQLCQRTASECSSSLTGPSSVANQTGRLGQIVKWVNAAWMDVQTRRDNWRFMAGSFTVNTTASDGKYAYTDCTDVATAAAISAFRAWRLDTLKIYLTSAGAGSETNLCPLAYDDWYYRFNTGTQTNSYPRYFTVDHDMALLLAPKPDGAYTVSGEYQKAATEMAADADIPGMPEEYHMAIVYRAMMKYGRYTGASEVYSDGEMEYRRMMLQMQGSQLPPNRVGGPLA
jgi:hypothetical protein